jgi:hypothetical protein
MEKTKEQMYEKRQEVIKRVLDTLRNECKDCEGFSCVISVNDGVGTATLCYGAAINLISNVASIEENKIFAKVQELKHTIEEIATLNNN